MAQMRSAGSWDIAQTFRNEYQMAAESMRQPDFTEGVTALLVRKEKPKWQPESLEAIAQAGQDPTEPFFKFSKENTEPNYFDDSDAQRLFDNEYRTATDFTVSTITDDLLRRPPTLSKAKAGTLADIYQTRGVYSVCLAPGRLHTLAHSLHFRYSWEGYSSTSKAGPDMQNEKV